METWEEFAQKTQPERQPGGLDNSQELQEQRVNSEAGRQLVETGESPEQTFQKKNFWEDMIPQSLKERIAAGLMVGITLMGPTAVEARGGGPQLKQDTEISSSTEWEGPGAHWSFFVRGADGKSRFNPWAILSPGQLEAFGWKNTDREKVIFDVPYEYSRLFDTGKPLDPEDHKKIADYIDQKLKEEYADKMSRFGENALPGFPGVGFKGNYEFYHPESEESRKPDIKEIAITGFASPEGPRSKGPETLKPGEVDMENLILAKEKRGETAMDFVIEVLKKQGRTQEEIDKIVKKVSGKELQFSNAEMSELTSLASREDGADPLEQIFHLNIKYNDYLEAKKKDPTLTDAYLDPMMNKLDDIIGSKRKVKITIKYEGDESTTTLLPVTWLVFLPLFRLRKRKKETTPIESKPEPTPESTPEPPSTPEDKNREQEVWIRDLYVYFEDQENLESGFNYEMLADEIYAQFGNFKSDKERIDFLTDRIIQGWKKIDLARGLKAGVDENELRARLDYENQPNQVDWAKKHAKALLWVVKVRRWYKEKGIDKSYMDIMKQRVRRMILREALRKEDPEQREARKEAGRAQKTEQADQPEQAELSKSAESVEEKTEDKKDKKRFLDRLRELKNRLLSLVRRKRAEDLTDAERKEYEETKSQLVEERQNVPADLAAEAAVTLPAEEGPDLAGEAAIKPKEEIVSATSPVPVVEEPKAEVKTGKDEVAKGLKLGPMAGRDYTNMTMEEIDAMIFNAEATAKSRLGIADEGLALWKEQKRLKELQQKEEETKRKEAEKAANEKKAAEAAEARRERAEEIKIELSKLYHEIWDKKQGLEEISNNLKRTERTGRMIEAAGLKDDETRVKTELEKLEARKKELEKELQKLEKGVSKPFQSVLKSAFEKTKKILFLEEEEISKVAAQPKELKPEEGLKLEVEGATPSSAEIPSVAKVSEAVPERAKKKFSLWKWTKERVKTIFKDYGPVVGEVRQAEMMRQGTGFAAANAEAMSQQIKTEWDVNNPNAVQDIVNEVLKTEKKTGIKMTGEKLNEEIERISGDRKRLNDDEKNYIIKNAIEDLKVNLAKARGQATSETVLKPENLAQVETEMRAELNKLSDAALVKDVKSFSKLMRDNLDEYWRLRYLYSGIELAALAGLGYYAWVSKEAVSLPNVARPKLPMPEALKPVDVPDDVRLMLDHYWGVAKGLLREYGILNPTDGQTMDVTKILAKDNNVGVKVWNIQGARPDTQLPVHWVLVKGAVGFILRNYIGTP